MGMNSLRRGGAAACIRAAALAAWLLLAGLLAGGCDRDDEREGEAAIANHTDPHWVFQHQPHARVAVVFVHGLFGDTKGTWAPQAPADAGFFNLLRAAPQVGDKVDIFAFGFTSRMFGSGSLNVREAASNLEESLKAHGVLEYEHLVFVAHSMGGLVTLRYLVRHRDQLERVPLVVLYASPMDGADIASIARHVASNPALAQMFDGDGNEFLATLNEDWAAIPAERKPKVRCAYETARTGPVMVVPRRSATRWCEGNLVAIGDANHIDIVKPDRAGHPSMLVLTNALNEVVFGSPREPLVHAPDFRENEAGEWVYAFRAGSAANRAALVNVGRRPLSYRIGRASDDKLLVTPRPTPRPIPVGAREELELFLLEPGRAQPEYTFELDIAPLGPRTVRVRVDDPAALQRMHTNMSEAALAGAGEFAEQNRDRLNALPEAEQQQALAEAARRSLTRWYGDLPESAQWLLTANALAATPFDALSATALRKVEDTAPAVAEAPAVQAIARDVAQRSNLRVFRDIAIPAPRPEEQDGAVPDGGTDAGGTGQGDLPADAAASAPDRLLQQADAARLRTAATRLQGIGSQRQAGLVLQGDLQRSAGRIEAAQEAYETAAGISATPAVRERLRVAGATER
jgi:pimeloyl-ACP methyl ester carboxylesterase